MAIVTIGFIVFTIVLYFCLWPVKIKPNKWSAPDDFNYGLLSSGLKLRLSHFIDINQSWGAEDICFDEKGDFYTGLDNGAIVKYLAPDFLKSVEIANTKGRPLGLMFDHGQKLIVADAHRGLLKIDPKTGEVLVLTRSCNQVDFYFTNNLDIASDGKIYFSDSSLRFTMGQGLEEVLEHGRSGRLMVYDPQTQNTTLLLDKLAFANGVVLSHDETFVLVVEVSEYRVLRYWLAGKQKGSWDIFIDRLPGLPDNLTRDSKGIIWLGLPAPRAKILDKTANKPFVRKMIYRIPKVFRPQPQKQGLLLGLDEDGKIKYYFCDPRGEVSFVSGATEQQNQIYLCSPSANKIPVLEK